MGIYCVLLGGIRIEVGFRGWVWGKGSLFPTKEPSCDEGQFCPANEIGLRILFPDPKSFIGVLLIFPTPICTTLLTCSVSHEVEP